MHTRRIISQTLVGILLGVAFVSAMPRQVSAEAAQGNTADEAKPEARRRLNPEFTALFALSDEERNLTLEEIDRRREKELSRIDELVRQNQELADSQGGPGVGGVGIVTRANFLPSLTLDYLDALRKIRTGESTVEAYNSPILKKYEAQAKYANEQVQVIKKGESPNLPLGTQMHEYFLMSAQNRLTNSNNALQAAQENANTGHMLAPFIPSGAGGKWYPQNPAIQNNKEWADLIKRYPYAQD